MFPSPLSSPHFRCVGGPAGVLSDRIRFGAPRGLRTYLFSHDRSLREHSRHLPSPFGPSVDGGLGPQTSQFHGVGGSGAPPPVVVRDSWLPEETPVGLPATRRRGKGLSSYHVFGVLPFWAVDKGNPVTERHVPSQSSRETTSSALEVEIGSESLVQVQRRSFLGPRP